MDADRRRKALITLKIAVRNSTSLYSLLLICGAPRMDRIDALRRSENMRRIRGKDTLPEIAVRKAAHAVGLRFRLHRKDLPGRPDIVMPSRRLALFVHGCFWHRHQGCRNCTRPATRPDFWAAKFDANVARDRHTTEALEALGWRVAVIWECETRDDHALQQRLREIVGLDDMRKKI